MTQRVRRLRLLPLVAVLLAAGACAPAAALATTFTGNGGTGDWNTASNWDAGIPTLSTPVVIPTGKTVTLTSGVDGLAQSLSVAGTGTLAVSGRNLTVSGAIGSSTLAGTGTQLTLGGGAIVSLGGTTAWNTGSIDVGAAGANTLLVPSGGTLSINGNLTATGGASSQVHVASGGAISCDFCHGPGQNFAYLNVPIDNDGTVSVTVSTTNDELRLGKGSATGSTSTGLFAASASATLAFAGSAVTYELGAGAQIAGVGATIRYDAGATVHLGAGASYGPVSAPFNGPASTFFNGGTLSLDTTGTAHTGAIETSGTGGVRDGSATLSALSGQFNGLRLGGGTTTVTGGSNILTNGLTVDGGAILNVKTASWQSGPLTVGGSGGGTINVIGPSGSMLLYPATGTGTNAGGGSLHVLSGATLDTSVASVPIPLNLPIVNDGTVFIGQPTTLNASSLTQGAGGETTVDLGGTLAAPTVTLNGGILDGRGTVSGAVQNPGGTVAPGDVVALPSVTSGTLHITGTYTQGAGGTFESSINGTAAGTLFDVLVVTGAVTLDGTLAVQSWSGFTPVASDTFQILTAGGGRSGQFASLTGAQIGALTYAAQYHPGDVTLAIATTQAPSGGPPSIPAAAQTGATIACTPGTWTGAPAFTYQWRRDGADIGAASGATYVLAVADAGHSIVCHVTATNPGGSAGADSNVLVPTAPAATNTPPGTTPPATTPPATTPPLSATKAIVLPSAKACVSRRAFRIRLVIPKGLAVARAVVLVNGRQAKVVTGARLTAPVDLRGLPKGRFTVKVSIVPRGGKPVSATRRYLTCVPKRR